MDRSASNRIAYKIMAVGETDQLRWNGKFQGSAAGLADAFIHMSTAMQLPATIEGSLPGPRQPHARGDHVASLGGAAPLGAFARPAPFPASLRDAFGERRRRHETAGAGGGRLGKAAGLKVGLKRNLKPLAP